MLRHSIRARRALLPAVITLLCALAPASVQAAAPVEDFTFVQVSDVHTPMPQSRDTIALVKALGEIDMKPYGVTVPKPSFVIVTGDLTEFGGGSGWWEEYQSYWKDATVPVYNVLGNHDNTWHGGLKALRDIGQGPYYSFDSHGCHFVALTTPTMQDPRPSVGEEELVWLAGDLAKAGTATPVFVFFHHPLGGTEFASRYDYDRLLDILRGYNTVLLLAGHSHGFVYRPVEDFDQITGGSTYGPTAGMMIVSIKGGVLRAAYRKAGEDAPSTAIIEKPLPAGPAWPKVEIVAPKHRSSTGDTLAVTARISGAQNVEKATCTVDDELNADLALTGAGDRRQGSCTLDLAKLLPGAHYLRVDFQAGDKHHTRSAEFFIDRPVRPTVWRAYLAASSRSTPAVADGVVYAGANDGRLHAIDAATGRELWHADTGAEILAEPLVSDGRIYTANGLGIVAAYSTDGKQLWKYTAGEAVYSSPILVGGRLIFGCLDGKLYGLDAETGQFAWSCDAATYSVESKPFAWNDKVYYGAWDQNVHCVDAKDGKPLWNQIGEGSRVTSAKRYYSPADAGPVVIDGKLMIADRDYMLTILDANTGQPAGTMKSVAATGISEDGKFAYLRMYDGNLTKIDSSADVIWTVPADLGAIPTAPVEKEGTVFVASGKGEVSAVSARWGKILWQYRASPQLWVMSSVASDGKNAYVTAFDGSLTAIKADR